MIKWGIIPFDISLGGLYDQTDNHQRFAAHASAAYQADYRDNAIGRRPGVSVCQLHGDADVHHQRADPCAEQ